jgi:hypothetical protein
MTSIAAELGAVPSGAARLRSSVSQKRVAPARPTMRSAPLTWCRCSGQTLSSAGSSRTVRNFTMLRRTVSSAWSTSAVIQERIVVSAMFAITPP